MSNKDILVKAMHELFEEKDLTALDRYWAEPYIQHSPNFPNGLDGLRASVPALQGFSWKPKRIVEQGDLVMAHSRVSGWIPEGDAAIVDIFRFEKGRIVEHWDVVQPYVPAEKTVSGNPMV
jgi:predicted SnoaL-like aldol condensation-catalyzing enzyme